MNDSTRHINQSVSLIRNKILSMARVEGARAKIKSYIQLQGGNAPPEVVQFSKTVEKRIKWSIEMKETLTASRLKMIDDFSSQNLDSIDNLLEWIDGPLPLSFYVNKFYKNEQNERYSFAHREKIGQQPSLKRIKTFFNRILDLFDASSLMFDQDGLNGYVGFLCTYLPSDVSTRNHILETLVNVLNGSGHDYVVGVMATILDRVSENRLHILNAWVLSPDFLSHSQGKNLIQTYLEKGITEKHLSALTDSLALTLLEDATQSSLICTIFDRRLGSSTDALRPFFQRILKKVLDEDNEDRKTQLYRHFHSVSRSSPLAREFFNHAQFLGGFSTVERGRILNLHTTVFGETPKSHLVFTSISGALVHFRGISEYHSNDLKTLFNKLTKTLSVEVLKNPGEVIEKLKSCADLLGLLHNKLDKAFFKRILDKILQKLDIDGDVCEKCEVLKDILNSLLRIDDQDCDIEYKQSNVYKEFKRYIESSTTLEELKKGSAQMSVQFYHFLCQNRYNDEVCQRWFHDLNGHLSVDDRNTVLSAVSDLRFQMTIPVTELESKEDSGGTKLANSLLENGFRHIHNNQMQALAAVRTFGGSHNLFFRLKTGQGKSLIAEMAAIEMLNRVENRVDRVFIFTSYRHLAKRDFESMKFLTESTENGTILLDEVADFSKLLQAKIIHADSDHFNGLLMVFLGNVLCKNQTITDTDRKILSVLFDFERNGLILDEGDLMTKDYKPVGRLHNMAPVFPHSVPFDMNTQSKEAFESNVVRDENFIRNIRGNFSSAYDSWYSGEVRSGHNDLERPQTFEASGKKMTFSRPLAGRLRLNNYSFVPFGFNFLSYIRQFHDCLFLSGSIDHGDMPAFQALFENGKANLFINLPSFFGSHNDDFNLRSIEEEGLLGDRWIEKIRLDITRALNNDQPVLVFVEPSKVAEIEALACEILVGRPDGFVQTVTGEPISPQTIAKIARKNTITVATTILGRGIDIKVSKEITHGLHVLITKLPYNGQSETEPNGRLLTQMKGRTGREDHKGSFSILCKENLEIFKRDSETSKGTPIDISSKTSRNFNLGKYFFEKLKHSSLSKNKKLLVARRWILFNETLHYIDDSVSTGTIKQFINNLFVGV